MRDKPQHNKSFRPSSLSPSEIDQEYSCYFCQYYDKLVHCTLDVCIRRNQES